MTNKNKSYVIEMYKTEKKRKYYYTREQHVL